MKQSIPIASWRDVGQALSLFDGFVDDFREPSGTALIETDKNGDLSIQLTIAVMEKDSTKVLSTPSRPKGKLGVKARGK